jgi:peptidoglycan/LPS O-acetylase OafA/YrhL
LFAMMIPCLMLVFLLATKIMEYPHLYLFRHIPASWAFVLLLCCLRKWEGSLPIILTRIGKKTYSLFIIHFIVTWEVAERVTSRIYSPVLGFLICYLITVGVSYGLALLVDRFYEAPLLNLKNRIFITGKIGLRCRQ